MGRKRKKGNKVTRVVDYTRHPNGWDVEPEEPLTDCNLIKATYLLLAPQVVTKCHVLMSLAGNDEWLGYLAISKEETADHVIYTAHDLIVPWQEVNGTSVHVCAFPSKDDSSIRRVSGGQVYLGGVVHSHHKMDIKFSSTDHEFINKNSEVSLLLANAFGFHAEAITQTLCGKKTKQEVQVIPFTKDKIIVFNQLEEAFRDRIRNTAKIVGYTNGWEYSYPTEEQAKEPITDVISLVNDKGAIEVIDLNGGDDSDNNQHDGVQEPEGAAQGSH